MIHRSRYKQYRSRFLARMAKVGNDIVLNWVTITGETVDGPTGAKVGGTVTPQTETIKGYYHFPEMATKSVQVFAEIEQGDCIVDIHPDQVIEGRERLTFTIDGQVYTQKKIGNELAKSWDMVHENTRFCRTLLLRRAT